MISYKNENMRLLIENYCSVQILGGALLILCPDDQIFLLLVRHHKGILQLFSCANPLTCVTIATEERRISFPGDTSYRVVIPNMELKVQNLDASALRNTISSEQELDIITEILGFEGSASMVRFADDNGLFSNSRINLSSGAVANDWVGKRMSDYWIPDELSRYKQALLESTRVSNFSYIAYLFTGQAAKFTVDARLTYYRGDLVRVVKNVACEKLD